MIARLFAGISSRAAVLLAVLLAAFLAAPWLVNDYLLTILIIILYFAYAGQAWNITGEPVHGLPADAVCRLGIARTFQIVRPFPGLSVEDNVTIGALLHRHDVGEARSRAQALLQQLDLFDKRDRIAATLTLPDRKRLEVARALATEPRLLLLDEVMAGLRPTETDRMVAILKALNRDGLTILLIEHVMRAVMALASRVLVLDHGVAIAEGAPEQVVRDPAVVQSYLGAEAV
jgi:branched-chain amino acid transport system ATP-binding protein